MAIQQRSLDCRLHNRSPSMFQWQNVEVAVDQGDLRSLWRLAQGAHFEDTRKCSLWQHAQGAHFGNTRKVLTLATCCNVKKEYCNFQDGTPDHE